MTEWANKAFVYLEDTKNVQNEEFWCLERMGEAPNENSEHGSVLLAIPLTGLWHFQMIYCLSFQ